MQHRSRTLKLLIVVLLALLLAAALPTFAQGGVTVRTTTNLRLRAEPTTAAPVLVVIPFRTSVPALALSADGQWVQVSYNGVTGWVARRYLRVTAGSLDGLAGAVPQPGGQRLPAASITFSADRTSISAGQCATLSWAVEGVREVYYQGAGVTGVGARTECPGATTTYTLTVVLTDGQTQQRQVVITVSGSSGGQTATTTGSSDQAGQVLALVNQARAAAGLGPLNLDGALNAAAQRHSADMAAHNFLGHTGSDGSDPGRRAGEAGYGWSMIGENAAQRWDVNAQGVFDQWMGSSGHRDNILRAEYTDMGLAYAAAANGAVYYTMVLGRR
jgi:uncharacterized protein YkwD/uncharacterized protein YraI